MLKKLVLSALCVAATGCASMVNSFTQDPVRVNGVKDTVATISLAANRRTVVVGIHGDNRGKFCAEPPPDVATDISSTLKAAIEARGAGANTVQGTASLEDTFKATSIILAQRTALLDVYRTATYALCQYHLNNALDSEGLKAQFQSLTKDIIEAMKVSMQHDPLIKPSTESPTADQKVSGK